MIRNPQNYPMIPSDVCWFMNSMNQFDILIANPSSWSCYMFTNFANELGTLYEDCGNLCQLTMKHTKIIQVQQKPMGTTTRRFKRRQFTAGVMCSLQLSLCNSSFSDFQLGYFITLSEVRSLFQFGDEPHYSTSPSAMVAHKPCYMFHLMSTSFNVPRPLLPFNHWFTLQISV